MTVGMATAWCHNVMRNVKLQTYEVLDEQEARPWHNKISNATNIRVLAALFSE